MASLTLNFEQVLETLQAATEENTLSSLRRHQLVVLPDQGEAIITGDLHDHRRNFEKVVRHADLGSNPARHLVLHELIHGDHYDENGAEDSWQLLYKAAELKCDFPDQVHFMLANHDLAQIHGEGIAKAGLSVCEAFNSGVKRDFAEHATSITVAITEFLLSFPLAVRCPNGIWVSHSLPTDTQIPGFDYSVFDRVLIGPDYARRKGPVYQLIWGRNITPQAVAIFAEKVNAQLIITGHQPQDSGYAINGPQHLIIASDHNQGVFLPIDLGQSYTVDELAARLTKFVAVE